MKRFFLMGGFLGFVLTFGTRMATGAEMTLALRDGMVGCLLLGFGFKQIYKQVEQGAVSIIQRDAERRLKEQTEHGDN